MISEQITLGAPLLYTKEEVGCEALSSISLKLDWIAAFLRLSIKFESDPKAELSQFKASGKQST